MKHFWLTILLFASAYGYSQEFLSRIISPAPPSYKSSQNPKDFFFEIDTVSLPFIDDFAVNRQKKWQIKDSSKLVVNLFPILQINGQSFDSLLLKTDTVWNYVYVTQPYFHLADSQPAAPIVIDKYSGYENPQIIDQYFFYPNYSLVTVDFQPYDTVYLPHDTVLYNEKDTFYTVKDDNSLWLDNHVFVNYTYGIDPPTIGLATFDGLDSLGHPYTLGGLSSGIADYLTSKPIDLENASNVILSFFYQPKGIGEKPDKQDSLVLEFYSPSTRKWYHQWSVPGADYQPFQYQEISITDTIFLKKGFQFRFKNYATLSGAFDFWHIDYVYLDKNRTPSSDFSVYDVGIKSLPAPFIENYTAVPWKHYDYGNIKSSDQFDVVNLLNQQPAPFSILTDFAVYQNQNLIYTSVQGADNPSPSVGVWTANIPVASAPNNFSFPTMNQKSEFYIKRYLSISDINPYNDTSVYKQVFDTYYAYDDGTPELAYSLYGAGAQLAYQYDILQSDTITAILMFLPEMLTQTTNSFQLKIWQDNNGTPFDVPIYESDFMNPIYQPSNEEIKFVRYEIDTLLVLPAGKYYFGFKQVLADQIFVGFDQNNDASSKIFYNVQNTWYNTNYSGALMIRPEFGESNPIYIIDNTQNQIEKKEVKIYPNPCTNELKFSFPVEEIQIFDLSGKLAGTWQNTERIDVSKLQNGLYFVKILYGNQIYTAKFSKIGR
jgi:hypothetical protein